MEQSDRQYLRGVITWSLMLMVVGALPLILAGTNTGISFLIGGILSLLNISLLIYTIQKLLFQQGKKSPLLPLISMGKLGAIGVILYFLFSPPAVIKAVFQTDGIGLLLGLSVPFMVLIIRGQIYYRSNLSGDLTKE